MKSLTKGRAAREPKVKPVADDPPSAFEEYQSEVWKRCKAELERLEKRLGDIETRFGHLLKDDRLPPEVREEVSMLYADAVISEEELQAAKENEGEQDERIKRLEERVEDQERIADEVYSAMKLWLEARRLPRDVREGITISLRKLVAHS